MARKSLRPGDVCVAALPSGPCVARLVRVVPHAVGASTYLVNVGGGLRSVDDVAPATPKTTPMCERRGGF